MLSLVAAMLASSAFAEEGKQALRLDVYPIAGVKPMEVHSILTNVSDKPVTLPTRSYSDGVDGWVEGGGNIGIIFSIGYGSIGEYKLVPSPLRYFPVTLRPGESTELPVIHATRSGEKTVAVTFAVDEDYARSNGWWFGHIKKKVTIGEGKNPYIVELPNTPLVPPPEKKQANQAAQTTPVSAPR